VFQNPVGYAWLVIEKKVYEQQRVSVPSACLLISVFFFVGPEFSWYRLYWRVGCVVSFLFLRRVLGKGGEVFVDDRKCTTVCRMCVVYWVCTLWNVSVFMLCVRVFCVFCVFCAFCVLCVCVCVSGCIVYCNCVQRPQLCFMLRLEGGGGVSLVFVMRSCFSFLEGRYQITKCCLWVRCGAAEVMVGM
jgi:hypothetical protein